MRTYSTQYHEAIDRFVSLINEQGGDFPEWVLGATDDPSSVARRYNLDLKDPALMIFNCKSEFTACKILAESRKMGCQISADFKPTSTRTVVFAFRENEFAFINCSAGNEFAKGQLLSSSLR